MNPNKVRRSKHAYARALRTMARIVGRRFKRKHGGAARKPSKRRHQAVDLGAPTNRGWHKPLHDPEETNHQRVIRQRTASGRLR